MVHVRLSEQKRDTFESHKRHFWWAKILCDTGTNHPEQNLQTSLTRNDFILSDIEPSSIFEMTFYPHLNSKTANWNCRYFLGVLENFKIYFTLQNVLNICWVIRIQFYPFWRYSFEAFVSKITWIFLNQLEIKIF